MKNGNLCSSSRKAKILTTGIYRIFRGLKFEPDTKIGHKVPFCKGLKQSIVEIIRSGKIIASYPDDEPYPSFLMLGFENDTPIHSVIARNENTGDCYVITVYFPKSDIWQAGFKKRRES